MSDTEALADLLAERDRLRVELEAAHEARRQAQSELAYVKARLAGARLILMRELKEQGWTPPNPLQAMADNAREMGLSYEGESDEHE